MTTAREYRWPLPPSGEKFTGRGLTREELGVAREAARTIATIDKRLGRETEPLIELLVAGGNPWPLRDED